MGEWQVVWVDRLAFKLTKVVLCDKAEQSVPFFFLGLSHKVRDKFTSAAAAITAAFAVTIFIAVAFKPLLERELTPEGL